MLQRKYLMAHFTGESQDGEQVYFAVSEDGLHWTDLNNGAPVLRSGIGEKGVRDPFILRSKEGDRFFILATDLRIANGKGWDAAQHKGSKSIIVWESRDLVHWSEERSCRVGVSEAGCVWAPEAIYEEEKESYMVFWASMVEGRHRIYCAETKDFETFSRPEIYIEGSKSVIDTTMVREDGIYYRFTKDETTGTVLMDAGPEPHGDFEKVSSYALEHLLGVEGPAIYKLPDGRWCLIVDRFAEGKGYLPLVCERLEKGNFYALSEKDYCMGRNKKRHGSVIALTEEEYQRLLSAWGDQAGKNRFAEGKLQNPILSGLYADPEMIKKDGVYYLYPTTDGFSGWSGKRFSVFSSSNLKDWAEEGVVLDLAKGQVPWAVGSAWAPAVCERAGKFYFYFCGKRPDGISCIGVAVSDSPISGFVAEKEPLLTPEIVQEAGAKVGQTIDPSVYEEDGKVYLLFGNGRPAIVELTEDLRHIRSGTLRNLDGAYEFREAITVLKKEGLYHFTWSCDDTGSEDYHVNYGISENLYGPIRYQYRVLSKSPELDVLGTGHHCILQIEENDYIMAYHRFATPTAAFPEGKGWHRELCLGEVCFSEGLMQPVKVR